MEKKLEKIYLTFYHLFIAQDLWQAHYRILTIIFLRKFIKINVIMKIMIKTVKNAELNINIATVSLNTQTLDII